MNKAKLNIIVDILTFVTGLVSVITGIILMFGTKGLSGIKELHGLVSILFVILVMLHLVMHWRWIKCIPQMWRCK